MVVQVLKREVLSVLSHLKMKANWLEAEESLCIRDDGDDDFYRTKCSSCHTDKQTTTACMYTP